MIEFPKDFLWGAAASAYQVEGSNDNSDWWEWEKSSGLKDLSQDACRHYALYNQDFDLARSLNHSAHRLSIEWGRIQPQEKEFSLREINHYKEVILSLRERNIEPIVTLHHFTNPIWFAKLGGWESGKSPDYFLAYVEKIVDALCDKVKYWVTINEPLVYVYHSYILGTWPPQKKSLFAAKKVENNLLSSHIKAYRLIHGIYKKGNLLCPAVSVAKNMQVFMPCDNSLKNKVAVYLRNKYFNHEFIRKSARAGALDFIGVNYYTRGLVEVEKWGLKNLLLDNCKKGHANLKKNTMGWEIYPQGLYELLLSLKRYNLPVFILENGICTEDDNFRWEFIRQHLESLHRAIREGVRVLGYLYWSLLDNFEWDKGFVQRFGLIGIDYSTYQRTIRESAKKFSLVCKTGKLG